jgi:glycosyltransferase involved in cell wall biosynthesis
MRVSVCIAATRAGAVGDATASILAQTHTERELIVVAQGSHAEEVEQAVRQASAGDAVRVVRDSGRGLSRARNVAIAEAQGEIVAFTDDDCEAEPRWLEELVTRFTAEPAVGLIGGMLVRPPRAQRGFGRCPSVYPKDIIHRSTGAERTLPGVEIAGANFAFRRSTIDTVGPFDEELGVGAHFACSEDYDYVWRVIQHGIDVWTTPAAVVRHTHGWRYGRRACFQHQHDYARGAGALSGKMAHQGFDHISGSLGDMFRQVGRARHTTGRIRTVPGEVARLVSHVQGYREVIRDFWVDDRGLLRRGRVAQAS